MQDWLNDDWENDGWENDLHSAARKGQLDLVKALVTTENINLKNTSGYTPFNCACYGGHLEVMKYLKEAGADVKLCNGFGWTPFHAACLKGQKDAVKFLLENGARDCINVSSDSTPTPLHVTVESMSVDSDFLKLILNAGANLNSLNRRGRTPLVQAIINGDVDLVKVLLEAGASVEDTDNGMITLQSAIRHSPLGDENMAKFLLDYGAGDISCRHCRKCIQNDLTVIMCLHLNIFPGRVSKKIIRCFKKYIVKMLVADLFPGKRYKKYLIEPAGSGVEWNIKKRTAFQEKCKMELAKMKAERVSGTNVTYLDVLYMRLPALRQVEFVSPEETLAKFPTYGSLLHCRFMAGRRKLSLLDQSAIFFELTLDPLPHLPPECVTHILDYLRVQDLQVVAAVCAPHQKYFSTQPLAPTGKRSSSESPEPAMKHPKLL